MGESRNLNKGPTFSLKQVIGISVVVGSTVIGGAFTAGIVYTKFQDKFDDHDKRINSLEASRPALWKAVSGMNNKR